jgi:uncharacterized membrane protein YhaH (DUF805 family)
MLGFLFGLNARLGRLQFFLASIALAIVMTIICFFIALVALRHTSPTTLRAEDLLANWPMLGAIAFFALASFTLQSMRIRDIGWDPVCVIPAWIALMIVDHVVATRFPAWSIGHEHQGTAVGALVNLVLMLALTFWPSGDHDGSPTVSDDRSSWRSDAGKPSIASERLARVAQGPGGHASWT